MALLLFPVDPVLAVRRAAAPVFGELETALREAAAALAEGDVELAERARARRFDEGRLSEAVSLGLEAARLAPRRRRERGRLTGLAEATQRLGAIARGTRVIAGSAARVLRARRAPEPELAIPVEALADAVSAFRGWLDGADELERELVRRRALTSAGRAARTPAHELGGGTIVHLVQSIAVDLLRATGLDGADVQRRPGEALAPAPPEARLPV
jgi:hypothetical protein